MAERRLLAAAERTGYDTNGLQVDHSYGDPEARAFFGERKRLLLAKKAEVAAAARAVEQAVVALQRRHSVR